MRIWQHNYTAIVRNIAVIYYFNVWCLPSLQIKGFCKNNTNPNFRIQFNFSILRIVFEINMPTDRIALA